ncbi:MAG: glycosyltransferase family 4 protein [Thermoleophilia bacterium]
MTGALAGRAPRSLFITNDFPPRIGGAQSYYWGAIRTLDPAEVTVLAPAHIDAAAFDATHPYTVVRAGASVLWPTAALLHQVEDLAARVGADLIQLGHPLPAGLLGPRLKERAGLPYVVFLGGAEVTLPGATPGARRLLDHVLSGASLLLTVSDYTARAARRQVRGAVPAEVLRPPILVDDFVPASPDETAALRARLGIDGELVVCVGRLVPRKGQDKLIDALALLRYEFPRLHLALVGEGRLATRLYDRAQRRGVGERVRLTGALTDSAVRDWLRAADLFASPCRTRWGGFEVEGFGIVFAEAALCGLPVVAGRSGGAPEAVAEGETGTVVDGRSAQQVAAALAALLRLPAERRREMGARGRELTLARHTPAVVGERYRALLRRAVGR